jgi:hypothetical protein
VDTAKSGGLVEQLPDVACGPPASRGGRVSLADERADGPGTAVAA